MNFVASYVFQRGETIAVALDMPDGGSEYIASITAKLRKIVGTKGLERPDRLGLNMSVTKYLEGNNEPEGYLFELKETDSWFLPPAKYALDARAVMIDNSVMTTEPVLVTIVEPADPGSKP